MVLPSAQLVIQLGSASIPHPSSLSCIGSSGFIIAVSDVFSGVLGDMVLVRNASVPDSLNSTLSASDLASSSSPRPPSARNKGRDSPLLSSPGNRRKQGLNESLPNSTKTQGLVVPPSSKPDPTPSS